MLKELIIAIAAAGVFFGTLVVVANLLQ